MLPVEGRGAQQNLRQAEERLEAQLAGLVDSIDAGVLFLDADGRILLASDRLASIFGLESRLLEFGTIDALIVALACHFLRPAETAARWREPLGFLHATCIRACRSNLSPPEFST